MRSLLLATGLVAAMAGVASARPGDVRRVEGEVVSSQVRWGYGGRALVTEATLRAADGTELRVHQLGGSRGGIGMIALHAPPVLSKGDVVGVEVIERSTASGRPLWSVARVYAPSTIAGEQPFVRTQTTRTQVPLRWSSGCALLTFDEDGTSHLPGDTELAVMRDVLARWRSDTASCSYFDLRVEDTADAEVGLDGINLVLFREDEWCRPAVGEDPEECYNPAAAGLTTLFFVDDPNSSRNGEIVDADIELNAVHFAVGTGGDTSGPGGRCLADLANTFTHEIGHLMGLDHTCWDPSGGTPQLRDDEGALVPRCNEPLPDEITEATMYNFQGCGETKKATPEPDDIAGVCAIYPAAEDPGVCEEADIDTGGGCCTVAGARQHPPGPGAALVLLLSAAALLLLRRRA